MMRNFTDFETNKPLGFDIHGSQTAPAVDIFETSDFFIIAVDIPGINLEDLDLDLKGNVITILGKISDEGTESRCLVSEFSPGGYFRRIQLGDAVDTRNIRAVLDNGVLKIKAQKKSRLPRRIPVLA